MKHMLQRDFLPPDYEQILFQQYQRCRQGQRTVHEYTVEFMRLAERNDLRETEGQQVVRYIDGLKLQIRDKIGVTTLKTLNEVKNLALRVELMTHEQSARFTGGRKNYGSKGVGSSSRVTVERTKGAIEKSAGDVEKKGDKADGKKPFEVKDTSKQSNPYAKPILGKCYRCNQPEH